MPVFAYRILGGDGRERRGELTVPDRRTAAERLRTGDSFVLDLRELPAGGGAKERIAMEFRYPLPAGQVVSFFRQLALMLRSGLPVVQALTVFADNCPHRRLRRAAGRISGRIQAGSAFSVSLAAERSLFPGLAVRMAATGEASGELDAVLERVAVELERGAELRTVLLTSLFYPGLVLLLTTGVVAFLVGNVIPKFARVLQSRNIQMPASTKLLLDVSAWVNAHALGLAVTAVAACLAIWLLTVVPRTRYWVDALLLRLPVVGGLLILAATAQFGRTLATLLASGVPLLEALRLLRESFGNRIVANRIAAAEAGLLEGRPLSQLLRGHPLPAMIPELLSVGEIAGNVDLVLTELGSYHEAQLRQRVKVISLLVEPAMVVVIGAIVGFVYLAFFQVLFQLSSR